MIKEIEEYDESPRERKINKRRDRDEMNKPMRVENVKDKRRDSEKFRREREDFEKIFEAEDE